MPVRTLRFTLVIALLGTVLIAARRQDAPQSGATPPERPRTRPPSTLTGWAEWEKAHELLKRIDVPPAPPLTPDDALKTFRLAPGYRIELVAAEPMVNTPIFLEFDPDGRIWVVEYQGYMRDLQGRGEADPICRIVVLEDRDADGRADASTVFLDGLVMPRSLSFVAGGVLVAEPPHLWFCADRDNDLRCDRKIRVGTYGHAGNPQHTANGLRYGIDNWLHSADTPKRHRFVDDRLIEADTVHRGQFGVTFDDEGRFLTSRENRPLIADLLPAEYLRRSPNLLKSYLRGGARQSRFGVNVNVAEHAQEVFPRRVTPAITLGALELRDDGRLRTYTVVAGTSFYNGDQFPADAYGNVFVPEAGGHLIGRLALDGEIEPRARRFYPDEQEFLTSTDERFRPVNSRVGPDGALYIADMYRGVIEHVIFMVPYIENQIRERRLDQGLDHGRIYRIVYEGKPIDRTPPRLSTATSAELVAHLSHPNGWWRLTAQRLLVERRSADSVPLLRDVLVKGQRPLGRLHALWTLSGINAMNWPLLQHAVTDADDRVRAAAVRLSEHLGESVPADHLVTALAKMSGDPSPRVRLQLVLTTGAFRTQEASALVRKMLSENDHWLYRAAAMTGIGGRELELLEEWLETGITEQPTAHQLEIAGWLAESVMLEARPDRVERVLTLLEPRRSAVRDAMLDGLVRALPRGNLQAAPIQLPREPVLLTRLTRSNDERVRQSAYRLHAAFTWPGAPALRPGVADVAPLSPEDRKRAERGRQHYSATCAACHQPDGAGLPNVAPRLAGSDWVTGPSDRLIRIVLHGLYGPIQVNDEEWNLHMPGLAAALDDEAVAGVLTYIRRAWGNAATAVRPERVAALRRVTASRTMAWTAKELEAGAAAAARVEPRAPIRPGEDGSVHLPARLATTYGLELAYRPSLDVLAPWRHEHDVAEWHVAVPSSGSYRVLVTLAADDASAGDKFVVAAERSRTEGVVQSSGGYDTFREYECGVLELVSGVNRVVMRPEGPLRRELADVRALRLVPVAESGSR